MFKFAKVAALTLGALLVGAAVTAYAAPRGPEMGITGQLTVINKSAEDASVVVNGISAGTAKANGGVLVYYPEDDSSSVTKLVANGLIQEWNDAVPENANKVKWTLTNGGFSHRRVRPLTEIGPGSRHSRE